MKSLLPKNVYQRNAEIYKIMANPKRLEILNLLREKKCSVDELTKIIGTRKANTSQHLAVLRSYRLVQAERRGLQVIYSIIDPRIVEPCRILKSIFS